MFFFFFFVFRALLSTIADGGNEIERSTNTVNHGKEVEPIVTHSRQSCQLGAVCSFNVILTDNAT